FLSHGPGFGFFVTADGSATFSLPRPDDVTTRDVLKLTFPGANPNPAVVGLDPLASRSNYFTGTDPSPWHPDVANHRRVVVKDPSPGSGLASHQAASGGRQLEYDFTVNPGAAPSALRLAWQGAAGLQVGDQGQLPVQTAGQPLVESAPVAYQTAADGTR